MNSGEHNIRLQVHLGEKTKSIRKDKQENKWLEISLSTQRESPKEGTRINEQTKNN